jgi:Ca2+-binding EF-hand superfamily protein
VPSWFTSRDKNKDGQIAMSEYRSSWSASAVRDFQRLDVNNDGVITAKEAAD